MITTSDKNSPDTYTYKAFLKRTQGYAKRLSEIARQNAYTVPESALAVIQDRRYQTTIKKAAGALGKVSHVILVGIGGSSLGTEAVYAALASKKTASLTVLDSIDSERLEALTDTFASLRSAKDVAIVIISKSGTTTETMLNARAVLEIAEQRFGSASILKRVICIGDKGTPFHKSALKQKLAFVHMPIPVGGRYSIFSAAGIVPLTLLNIDTAALLRGAASALTPEVCGVAAKNASLIAAYAKEGRQIVNFFTFHNRLERLGFWYRQLLAESVGKATTKQNHPFVYPIVPIVSTSEDLHSMAQLYLSGDKRIFTHFVYAKEHSAQRASETHWVTAHVPFLKDHTNEEVRGAIKDGVLHAYDDQKLPYRYTELAQIDAHEIGHLLTLLMCEVMCLAHAFDVNAFDQPNVELYKQHTREALG